MPQKVIAKRGRTYRTVNGRKKALTPYMKQKQEEAREKQEKALELRKAGATYAEIAVALGYYNSGGAKKAVDRAMERTVIENAQEIILLDLQRLDELQKRLMAQLRNKNDLSQVDRILRVMQQRYALAGIGEETAKEIREAMGITQQITQNNTQLVIQVNPNSEEAFIRRMMGATGASSETIDAYVQEKLGPQKELEPGPKPKKKKVVRRKKSQGKAPVKGLGEHTPIVGKLMGVVDENTTMEDLKYKDSIAINREPNSMYGSLNEEDIIDVDVID